MKYFIAFLATIISQKAISQEFKLPSYIVYLVKGPVTKITKEGEVPIKQKEFIFDTDRINLTNGGEITLTNEKYFISLKKKEIYNVSQLSNRLVPLNTRGNIVSKYMHLLWHEISPEADAKLRKENFLGVERDVTTCNNLIFPIHDLKTSEDSIHFAWLQTSPTSNYTFFLYDRTGKEIIKQQLKDTQYAVNMNKVSEGGNGKYYWLIKGENAKCEEDIPIRFELLSKDEELKLTDSLEPKNKENDLFSQLQWINKLEKNGLIYVASKGYFNIVKANLDDTALLKSYIAFLLKYGFDEEAHNMWDRDTQK